MRLVIKLFYYKYLNHTAKDDIYLNDPESFEFLKNGVKGKIIENEYEKYSKIIRKLIWELLFLTLIKPEISK